jgi:hypothetical protein
MLRPDDAHTTSDTGRLGCGHQPGARSEEDNGWQSGESDLGSFTDPEYAQVGLSEKKAREKHDVVTAVVGFDSTTRTIIDGRTTGFCKLIVDRATSRILGCHVVGERAVDITQVAAIAITAGMRVDDLAQVPLSFPTYTAILRRAAATAARQLNLKVAWQANQAEDAA